MRSKSLVYMKKEYKDVLIKEALNTITKKIVHIADVSLQKEYTDALVCVSCKNSVGIKDGDQRVRHFYHINKDVDCSYSPETYLHRQAKEVLKNSKGKDFVLPVYDFELTNSILYPNNKNKYSYIARYTNKTKYTSTVKIDDVKIEHTEKLNNNDFIIADAVIFFNEKKCLIEFRVTHGVDQEKFKKIKKLELSCIEIDLNNININNILTDTQYKYWIYNKYLEKRIPELKKECEHNIENIKTIEKKILTDLDKIKRLRWETQFLENSLEKDIDKLKSQDHELNKNVYSFFRKEKSYTVDIKKGRLFRYERKI